MRGLLSDLIANYPRIEARALETRLAAVLDAAYLLRQAEGKLSEDSARDALVVLKAAIELAHGFGLTVCGGGVEDIEDLGTLIDLGCHTAQGFLFAKPMDATALRETMSQAKVSPLS